MLEVISCHLAFESNEDFDGQIEFVEQLIPLLPQLSIQVTPFLRAVIARFAKPLFGSLFILANAPAVLVHLAQSKLCW